MNARSLLLTTVLVLFSAILLGACGTPSVHPIYTKDDETTDERLAGSWTDEEGKTTYTVSKTDSAYRLHVGAPAAKKDDKATDSDLELHLVRLGDRRAIDVAAPAPERSRVNDRHGTFFVPTHMFALVELHGDTLTVRWLKNDFVRQCITDKSLSGTALEDQPHGWVLITSDTDKLRAFLRNQADNGDAWEKAELHRVKTPAVK